MMRMDKIGQWMAVMALAATMLATQRAAAAEVSVPQGALALNTTFVMWADSTAFNEKSFGQAMTAVISAAPEEEQERMKAEYAENMKKMQSLFEVLDQSKADGIEAAVFSMLPQDEKDPAAKPLSQMFINVRPGTDPKATLEKSVKAFHAWMKEYYPENAADEETLLANMEKAEYKKINETWYALQVEGQSAPLPEPASAADPAPFIEAMQKEQGAPVRFAFVMTDQMKQQLQQAAANPNAAMMAGLMQPLTDMQTATGGLWLGAEPKMRVSMNFGQAASAQTFKTSADGMIQFMGQMMAMQGAQQNPNAAGGAGAGQGPDMEKIQAVLPLMMLDHEGEAVSKTLDIALLKALTEAGIPWYEGN